MRKREETPAVATGRRAPLTVPVEPRMPPPPAPSGFNPMKIIIPSAVALLVVFAAFWVFNRPAVSGSNTNAQTETLAADPNSQPVQPGASPTGKGEEGIPSGGTISPPAIASPSPAASVEASIDPLEDVSPAPTPANENSNANSNRKAPALPEPTRSIVPETPPPPAPSATKPPEQKPSPAATPI